VHFPRDLRGHVRRTSTPRSARASNQRQLLSEDAARTLVYLAIQNAVPQWTRIRGWTKALLASKIQFGDRLPN